MTDMPEDDSDLADQSATVDLAARIGEDTPEDDAFVLRVLAARLADRVDSSNDPRAILRDMSQALESLSEATEQVVTAFQADALTHPEAFGELRTAVTHLSTTGREVAGLATWF